MRFVSVEPLLGPVDLTDIRDGIGLGEGGGWLDALRGWSHDGRGDGCGVPRLDWVIVGGESGPEARPMHPNWARELRDQCVAAGVSFFFKQWGGWGADGKRRAKAANGRLLNGRVWDQMPNQLIALA